MIERWTLKEIIDNLRNGYNPDELDRDKLADYLEELDDLKTYVLHIHNARKYCPKKYL